MCNHEIDFQEKNNNFDSYMYSAISLCYLKLETIILACVEFCIVFIFLIWIQFIDMYLLCFYRPHRMVQAQRKFAKRHPLSPNRYKFFFKSQNWFLKKLFNPSISIHILYTFPLVLTRRIQLTIEVSWLMIISFILITSMNDWAVLL